MSQSNLLARKNFFEYVDNHQWFKRHRLTRNPTPKFLLENFSKFHIFSLNLPYSSVPQRTLVVGFFEALYDNVFKNPYQNFATPCNFFLSKKIQKISQKMTKKVIFYKGHVIPRSHISGAKRPIYKCSFEPVPVKQFQHRE